jgi:hypothetical protein
MSDTTWPKDDQRSSEQRAAVQRQPAKPEDLNPIGDAPNQSSTNPPNKNPNQVDHTLLHPNKQEDEGGREMGLVHAPTVSLNPTSASQSKDEKPEFKMVDKANFKLSHYMNINGHTQFKYPFEDISPGQGMFIPVPKGRTTDQLMREMYKSIDQYRKQNSEVERDENGDDIMEDVAINTKKRNADGTVQLDDGVPRLGISSGFRPRLLGPNFVVKAVVKGDSLADGGDKANTDGVLVVRMS